MEFFRKDPGAGKSSCLRRARCKGCEGEIRHEIDHVRRWLIGTLSRHAIQDGYRDRHDFGRATGMTVEYMEPIVLREREHGHCSHCGHTWADLFQKFNERMELDRVDRNRPLTRSNWQFMCQTGNRQKGKQDPTEFDISQQCWRHYRAAGKAFEPARLF